ncbi:MAG: SPOR domain-containing protein [Proteobacteria bacterium]|nr:SPOR domain-containing protein [Pseudomonadota bacterium]MDA0926535.1 SPOR domain-containing protein [Pseudomonadota bacterium]
MTQDFAKIRPEPLLEKKPVENPPAWSLMITGVVLGITIGVFACVLLYLSGNVPPIAQATIAQGPVASAEPLAANTLAEPEEEAGLELEFYRVLPENEVIVDATPVDISSQDPDRVLETPHMLQAGAFERRELADTEKARQENLGLTVIVKEQTVGGRTLFLVQSGPYNTNGEIEAAKTVYRRNNISSLPVAVR